MAQVHFTPHLRRHVAVDDVQVEAATVRDALEVVFEQCPQERSEQWTVACADLPPVYAVRFG